MIKTLGIHIGHDGGAAISIDGEIKVACAEERLTRKKYANGWLNSVKYCLEFTKLNINSFDQIIFSNTGQPLEVGFDGGLNKWSNKKLTINTVDHHLSHAIGGFCYSGFQNAIVFVGDAGGNNNITESIFLFDNTSYELVQNNPKNRLRCKGLGTTYEAFTNFLGFADQESGKTMALAAYGEADIWKNKIYSVDKNGNIFSELENLHQWGVVEYAGKRGLNFGSPFQSYNDQKSKDIAFYIQNEFSNTLLTSLKIINSVNKKENIVISGGVGLNCTTNSFLRNQLENNDLYFFPACSDIGLPIGNALYGHWLICKKFKTQQNISFLLGKEYDEHEIKEALIRHPKTLTPSGLRPGGIKYIKSQNIYRDAAQLIDDGKIIAWYQGRSETGPRALGARSIIANPVKHNVREIINQKIKLRERFRPFAPSMLSKYIDKFIKSKKEYHYMIEAPLIKNDEVKRLGECVHLDGTSRIQTVKSTFNHRYYRLLKEIEKYCGYGIVLNTSFNIHEPIVETPEDAVSTFLRSELDYLILGDFICEG